MFDSGITTLNLAISGKPDSFAEPGNTISYVGDSDAGKTVGALTTQAASFYRLKGKCKPVYYAFEPNLMIDIERLYGKKFAKDLDIVNANGMTIEKWQGDLRGRLSRAKLPVVAVIDSTDSMKSQAEVDAIEAMKKGTLKDGYGAGKAAAFSLALPEVTRAVSENKGLMILISQVRDNVGVLFGPKKKRSGGHALNYYSELNVWFHPSTSESIENVKVGGWTKIEVKRNKVTGDARTIFAPIYPSYGVDNTRSMLHFLVDVDPNFKWVGRDMMKLEIHGETKTTAKWAEFYEAPEQGDMLERMVIDAWNKREASVRETLLADRKSRWS